MFLNNINEPLMTAKRQIFGGDKRGIEVNGGRKANILATMARKAEQSIMSILSNYSDL
jgi:hypothetical protein